MTDTLIIANLIAVLLLLGLGLFILARISYISNPQNILEGMEHIIRKIWFDSGVERKIGEIEMHARELKNIQKSLEQLLRTPAGRASIGEITLQEILKDQLPPDMFAIKKRYQIHT